MKGKRFWLKLVLFWLVGIALGLWTSTCQGELIVYAGVGPQLGGPAIRAGDRGELTELNSGVEYSLVGEAGVRVCGPDRRSLRLCASFTHMSLLLREDELADLNALTLRVEWVR